MNSIENTHRSPIVANHRKRTDLSLGSRTTPLKIALLSETPKGKNHMPMIRYKALDNSLVKHDPRNISALSPTTS